MIIVVLFSHVTSQTEGSLQVHSLKVSVHADDAVKQRRHASAM